MVERDCSGGRGIDRHMKNIKFSRKKKDHTVRESENPEEYKEITKMI